MNDAVKAERLTCRFPRPLLDQLAVVAEQTEVSVEHVIETAVNKFIRENAEASAKEEFVAIQGSPQLYFEVRFDPSTISRDSEGLLLQACHGVLLMLREGLRNEDAFAPDHFTGAIEGAAVLAGLAIKMRRALDKEAT